MLSHLGNVAASRLAGSTGIADVTAGDVEEVTLIAGAAAHEEAS